MTKPGYTLPGLVVLALLALSAQSPSERQLAQFNSQSPVVRAVFVDAFGAKWFGTDQGLVRFDDLHWTYFTDQDQLAGMQVTSLTHEQTDQGKELWIGTDQGLTVFAYDADGVTAATSYTTENGLLENGIIDVGVDSRGGKFIASHGGLNWFHDGSMDTLAFLDYYSFMFDAPIREVHFFKDTLYLAQEEGIGRLISEVDGVSGASRWDGDYGIAPYSTDIRSILVQGESMQYFGTEVGAQTHEGYFAKEGWELISTEQGLVNNEVIAIAEDPQGGLWFGTTGGLSHLSEDNWTSYTTADGLLDNVVHDLAFEEDGSVWIATGAGVNRLKDGVLQDFLTALEDEALLENTDPWATFLPAESMISLEYTLAAPVPVSATLFDLQGRTVGQWTGLAAQAGKNQCHLPVHVGRIGTGLHILQLKQGSRSYSTKIVIAH